MKRIHPTTTILTCRFSFVLVLVSLFLATTGHALDFYGATITDRELPTSFFKLNLYGIRPIVDHVTTDSPADKFGLRQGDVILSINGKSIAKASDFSTLIKEKNEIRIIRGLARKRIIVTRATIEAAQQAQHVVQKAEETAPKVSTPASSDTSSAIRFDDAALEKKFGKTTPAQREALRQQNQQRIQQEEADAAARKQRLLQEEKQQVEAKAAAEAARKQQEALDEQRRAAEKEAARQRWIENQRIERNRLRQQQLNEMQEKIDRLEREKSKRATETK
jgi:murein DD-endopeptidase MepM/ murein hydrolase activator NlpD